MKKGMLLAATLLLSPVAFAAINLEPLLDQVTLQLQAEDWLTTQTALVDVSVNAAVNDKGIERIQAEVMNQLKRLSAKVNWHIVSFNRQQDRSGLDSIQIMAEARMPQSELVNLRGMAKNMSKPGETYTIDNIQFTPSEDEIRVGNNALRANLYNQAKAELETLNKMYPEQKYTIHKIDFMMQEVPVMPMARNMMALAQTAAVAPAPLNVGNKLKIQAMVVLASMPNVVAQQIKP